MDDYYQNGPLPTWIAWHAQHLPHWFHAGTAAFTLGLELVLIWMACCRGLPHRALLDLLPLADWNHRHQQLRLPELSRSGSGHFAARRRLSSLDSCRSVCGERPACDRFGPQHCASTNPAPATTPGRWREERFRRFGLALSAFFLTWVFYGIAAQAAWMILPDCSLPTPPVDGPRSLPYRQSLWAFRGDDRGRYEIEFQGSNDGAKLDPLPFPL